MNGLIKYFAVASVVVPTSAIKMDSLPTIGGPGYDAANVAVPSAGVLARCPGKTNQQWFGDQAPRRKMVLHYANNLNQQPCSESPGLRASCSNRVANATRESKVGSSSKYSIEIGYTREKGMILSLYPWKKYTNYHVKICKDGKLIAEKSARFKEFQELYRQVQEDPKFLIHSEEIKNAFPVARGRRTFWQRMRESKDYEETQKGLAKVACRRLLGFLDLLLKHDPKITSLALQRFLNYKPNVAEPTRQPSGG